MTSFIPNWNTTLNAVNVKDYGAQGIGTGFDDTAAIQSAIDAAWGPVSNPHGADLSGGVTGPRLNRPLYFPAGDYNVTGIASKSIVAMADNGSRYIRVQVADTTDLQVGWIVYISGTVSTPYAGLGVFGPTQYTNSPRGIKAIPDSTHFDLQLTELGVDAGGAIADFNGTLSGTILTINSSVVGGPIAVGQTLYDSTGASLGTTITSNIDSTHWNVNNPVSAGPEAMSSTANPWGVNWNSVFDSGTGSVQTAALHVRAVESPLMFGDGQAASRIRSGAGNAVISTNGFGNGVVRDMGFVAVTGAYCAFDFNWTDKASDLVQTRSSQNMEFNNCSFGGQSGMPYVMIVGWGGRQTDTSTWINCNFGGNAGGAGTGLYLGNQNSIGHSIWGGNYQGFANYSVDSGSGNFLNISGATFTNNPASTSIRLENITNATTVSGCSSEDLNFIECHAGLGLAIDGCEHRGGAGNFLYYEGSGDPTAASGHCTISGCWSAHGVIAPFTNGYISIIDSAFGVGLKTALATFNGTGGRLLACEVGPLTFANLPTPSAQLTGVRMRCSDCPIAPTGGFASFTGVIGPASTTLATSSVTGQLAVGQLISGAGVSANTYIVSGPSGANWTLNNSQSVSSEPMFASGNHNVIISAGGGSNEVMLWCDGTNWRLV